MINYYLAEAPPCPAADPGRWQNLILDGTFLHRPKSIIAMMDGQTYTLVSGQYGISENSERQLMAFFSPLKQEGLSPRSFTVDGNPQAIKVIGMLWPGIKIQRCLIHVQRQGLSWCRRYPKTAYARMLRDIFLEVTNIRSVAQRDEFLARVSEWEDKYGSLINTKPEIGRVFSDIKRARSMLLHALPNMFHYLDAPQISNSTNSLEGYFSRLKSHYRQHRGMSKAKRMNYFYWYFYFVPK